MAELQEDDDDDLENMLDNALKQFTTPSSIRNLMPPPLAISDLTEVPINLADLLQTNQPLKRL